MDTALLRQIPRIILFACFLPLDLAARLLRACLGRLSPWRADPAPRSWTLWQTLAIIVAKSVLKCVGTFRVVLPESFEPGAEGPRFCTVSPADPKFYAGPLLDDEVRPGLTGGTWTPARPSAAEIQDPGRLRVLLHFHGGGYIMGDGRDHDTGYLVANQIKHAGCTHVFTPQYRLSTTPAGRFPAALQDAVSTYVHLVHDLGIPPSRIAVGGDSAGGNLAIGLLRYISEHGSSRGIPWPAAAVLWSPWTDLAKSSDRDFIRRSLKYSTDFIHEAFPIWGVQAVTGSGKISPFDPYLTSTHDHAFKSPTPMFVHTGFLEMLYDENKRFVEGFRGKDTEVEWVLDDDLPHDAALIGGLMGFDKQVVVATKKAGRFLDHHCPL